MKQAEDSLLFPVIEIRHTKEEDVEGVMAVIDDAKAALKNNGIPQWQDGYPNADTICKDVQDDASWVMEKEGRIIGTCCIRLEKDPNYSLIEEGEWLNEEDYAVIHRIAVSSEEKGNGYALRFFAKAEELAKEKGWRNLRADTHEKNRAMQRALSHFGFMKCGRVYMADGAPRLAYQKVLKK